jgi:hypothetical protein
MHPGGAWRRPYIQAKGAGTGRAMVISDLIFL